MGAVKILLGIVCLAAAGSHWGVDRNFIGDGITYQNQHYGRSGYVKQGREKIIVIAQKEIGVQETVENGGARVDQYNAYVGFKKVPWCASFVSWCHGQAGCPQPRTAWSPSLFPAERLAKDPLAGMVFGIYFKDLKRIGHCGIVYWVNHDWVFSIEGNSNLNGSREGTGVYSRMRHIRSIHRFSDWLK